MAYQWSTQLSVGIKDIDAQHQELFKRINTLLEAMHAGKGKFEVSDTIAFLGDYIQVHFTAEEQLMKANNFTGYTSHKLLHAGYIRSYNELKTKLENEGPTPSLTLQLQRQLGDWLVQHIGKVDQVYAAYIKSRQIAA